MRINGNSSVAKNFRYRKLYLSVKYLDKPIHFLEMRAKIALQLGLLGQIFGSEREITQEQ